METGGGGPGAGSGDPGAGGEDPGAGGGDPGAGSGDPGAGGGERKVKSKTDQHQSTHPLTRSPPHACLSHLSLLFLSLCPPPFFFLVFLSLFLPAHCKKLSSITLDNRVNEQRTESHNREAHLPPPTEVSLRWIMTLGT